MAIGTTAALLLSAAAAGLQAYNGVRTANKQKEAISAGLIRQGANRDQANARVNETVRRTAESDSADEKKKIGGQYLDQIMRQMGQAQSGLATRGLSAEYDAMASDAGGKVADYGKDTAGLFARMDAPIEQRRGEAASFGNLGMDLTRIGGNVQGDDFLTKLKVNSITRSPWLDLMAGLASGAATSGGSAWGMGAEGGYTPTGYGTTWGTGNGLGAAANSYVRY
jgi:hypothetical protein